MKQQEKAAILIVDDQPNNLMLLEEMLSSLGQTVIKAGSGQEAIKYIEEQEFAVIILDVNMPGMNGFQLAEYIRNQLEIEPTPIIFLTGMEISDINHFKGYELGAVDYLTKPVDTKILRSKVSVFVQLFLQKQQLKHSMEEIAKTNQKLEAEIIKFEEAQTTLSHLAVNLENLVEQRTIELQQTNINLEKEIKKRQHIEEVLKTIALGFSETSVEAFCQSLVQYLVKAEGIDYAFICELFDLDLTLTQVPAFYTDGQVVETLDYSLINTPYQEILKNNFCIYSNDVQHYFPNDILFKNLNINSYAGILLIDSKGKPLGILAVMGCQSIDDLHFTQEILQIFAVRASAELERQHTEKALRDSEHRYRLILSNISDAVLITDEQGDFTYICPNVKTLFGYSCQEIEQMKTIYQLLGENLFVTTQLTQTREIINIERTITDKFGNPHVVLINVKQVSINDGKILYTCRDITERKQAEASLLESQARLAKAQEIAHVGNWDWNILTDELYWSDETYRIFGQDIHSFNPTQDTFFASLCPKDRERVKQEINEALYNHKPYNINYRILRPDGEIRIIQAQGDVSFDPEMPLRMFGTVQDITDSKLMEENLRQSEEKFRNIVTATADGLIVMNQSGYIYFINPAAEGFFGLKAKELSGYQWNFSLNHDSTELAVEHPNGKLLFLEVKIVETLWDDEQVHLICLRDITERKQAEEALKLSEKRYRDLINNLHAGVVVHGADTKIILSNPKASELLELTLDQMLGKKAIDPTWYFLREDETKMPTEEYPVNLVISSQKPVKNYVIGINQRKKKGIAWLLVNAFGEFNSYGQINQVVVTFVDITKFKQAQEALQQSKRRYETLAQASPVGIFRTDTKGNCLYVNQRWQAIAGLTWQQALGKGWSQAIYSQDRTLVSKEWEKFVQDNLPFQTEYRIQRPDGSLTWVYGQAIAETDEQGILKGYLGTITDISDRKEAEMKLQRLNDKLEQKVEARTLHLQRANQQLRQEIFERQQTEVALKKSEERFRASFEQAAVGMVLVSLEKQFLKVNPKFCQMLGYSPEELRQKNVLEITHPDDRSQVPQKIEPLITGEILTLSFEKRLLHKTGETIWTNITISLVHGASGDPDYLIEVIEDISDKKHNETERQAAQEALQKSEAQLRSMFEYAAVGIAFVDSEGKPFNSNPALQKFLGYSSQELAQMPFTEYTHPEDVITDLTLYQELFATNRNAYQIEKRYIRKDGQLVWGHLTVSLVRNSQGKPQFAIGMVEDISDTKRSEAERKLAEEALRENQAFLRNVIDTVPNFIFVKNWQGKYTLANQAIATAYGMTVEELEGKSDADFQLIPAEVTQVQANDQQVINSLQSLLIPEEPLTLGSGEVRYFQTLKTPLISPDGKAHYILGVSTDITERKQIQQEIEKALAKEKELNQLKTQFIDIVSHEFRTPLTSIFGYAELLERHSEKLTPEKKLKHLQNIKLAGQRLNDLIEDVLCISRAESGKLMFNPTPLDVKTFCQDLIEEIQIAYAQRHQIIFREEKPFPNCKNALISLDEKLLRHILTNLLSNAIKYSPLGSQVELSLQYERQQIIFEISDRGIGIPVEDRPKLFDSFYRASNVGNIPGTGLGLNIVQKYVILHGGSIDFTSRLEGGTTFKVSLPILKILC